jgi:hypothetical protein
MKKRNIANQKPPEPEAPILRGILDACGLLGIVAVRSNAGGGWRLGKGGRPQLVKGMPEGWPDITGWIPGDGRFLGVEAKAPGEKPSREQVYTMRTMNSTGAVAFWADDIEVATRTLLRIKQGARIVMNEAGEWSIEA